MIAWRSIVLDMAGSGPDDDDDVPTLASPRLREGKQVDYSYPTKKEQEKKADASLKLGASQKDVGASGSASGSRTTGTKATAAGQLTRWLRGHDVHSTYVQANILMTSGCPVTRIMSQSQLDLHIESVHVSQQPRVLDPDQDHQYEAHGRIRKCTLVLQHCNCHLRR